MRGGRGRPEATEIRPHTAPWVLCKRPISSWRARRRTAGAG